MRRGTRCTTGNRNVSLQIICLLVILFLPAGALAEQATSESDAWQFGASIYGWFPDITGQTVFLGTSGGGDFAIDIEDILDNLEFTLMGIFDMRKGRWGLLTDIIYMDVGASQTSTREATIGGIQIPVNAAADVNLDLESWIWSLAGYYRLLDQTGNTMDVVLGTRFLDVEQTVKWNVTGNIGSIPVPDRTGAVTADLSNWDIIMGVKGRFAFGAQHAWFVPYYLDFGSGESDFTWQGIAGLGYAAHWGEITAFWRYLYYDLSGDKLIRDMSFSGPAIGYTFRW